MMSLLSKALSAMKAPERYPLDQWCHPELYQSAVRQQDEADEFAQGVRFPPFRQHTAIHETQSTQIRAEKLNSTDPSQDDSRDW